MCFGDCRSLSFSCVINEGQHKWDIKNVHLFILVLAFLSSLPIFSPLSWFPLTSSLGLLNVVQVTTDKWTMEISKPAQGFYIWFSAPGSHSAVHSWGLVLSLACLFFLDILGMNFQHPAFPLLSNLEDFITWSFSENKQNNPDKYALCRKHYLIGRAYNITAIFLMGVWK